MSLFYAKDRASRGLAYTLQKDTRRVSGVRFSAHDREGPFEMASDNVGMALLDELWFGKHYPPSATCNAGTLTHS